MVFPISPTTIALVAAVAALIYWFFTKTFDYWEKRGIPYAKPTIFVGNTWDVLIGKESFGRSFRGHHAQFRDVGYCGVFQFRLPILLVFDPELIKQVLTKDFSSFHDRGLPHDEADPLSVNLFNLEGNKWRNLRNRLSPTFTSGKLKLMFHLMKDVSGDLSTVIRRNLASEPEMDFKDLLTRYATDVVGSCAFGIQCNSLAENNGEFLQHGKKVLRPSILDMIRNTLASEVHPKLAKLVPMKLVFREATSFFLGLMKNTVEYREKNKVERNDFVNLMMQLRESDGSKEDPENHIELTHNVMTAQAFVFFVAGMDSVANTVGWALHELVLNPELQERAAAEVREHGQDLTYDALKKMPLIKSIINEALRKYTPIGVLFRKANAKVHITGNLTVDPGTVIMMPTDAMHRDPVLYPDPERFDPGRWVGESAETRHPYAFLPFGEGPRLCIAERFVRVEMNLCLAALLNEFHFSAGPKFEKDPKLENTLFGPAAQNGYWFRVAERP